MTASIRTPNIPGADPDTRRPSISFPRGACDCHAHVFGPQARFPYVEEAGYIPPDALTADYIRMLSTISCERAVLVQPSVYSNDNSAMLEALRSGMFAFRGVAVIDETISDRELEELHQAGVRGVRINIASETPGLSLEHAPQLAPRLKALGWHLQVYMDLKKIPDAEEKLANLKIDIVIDHFARAPAAEGVNGSAFQALLRLIQRDNCWAKIMGPYFISAARPRFPDVTPLARAVVAAAPDRVVWGTDWPHPGARALMPNDGTLADLLADWVPDEVQRRKVLVTNPARLYGF